jgi:hypothetical protein
MPRGIPNKKKPAVDTKSMSAAEYEREFGRKKPGPAPGFKKKGKAAKSTAKAGYFPPGRVKPGPKPGFKKKGKATVKAATTGRWASKEPAVQSIPKKGKDLGPPPRRQKFGLGEITQAALDLKETDLFVLHEQIELKLAGDTSGFGPDEWGAVQELINSGYSKLNAIKEVRSDAETDRTNEETMMNQTPFAAAPEEAVPPVSDETDETDETDEDNEEGDDEEGEDEEDGEEEPTDESTAAATST